ncbi:hypothetical protein EVAR_53889_1 [Eumeta japonica]|uniref:Uncharacterized protein n=1 Tax=Eumeta variegata TaxID=151549 RepID=A0A4C1XDW8_EUMVA|nr:hypothetical protein EVAR_53889_1 [Eumeta japonica]
MSDYEPRREPLDAPRRSRAISPARSPRAPVTVVLTPNDSGPSTPWAGVIIFQMTMSTEDIKVLLLAISSIDIGELTFLAKKFKAAANPVEKIIDLAVHASFVKAIQNNTITSVQIKLPRYPIPSRWYVQVDAPPINCIHFDASDAVVLQQPHVKLVLNIC